MDRVDMAVDPELDAAFPKKRAAHVEIETSDGRRFAHAQNTRKGDPDDPLSDAELDDKFIELASPVIGRAAAQTALSELHGLETRGDSELLAPETVPTRQVA
jgi:2-methylcitrate dehydratase PrpD